MNNLAKMIIRGVLDYAKNVDEDVQERYNLIKSVAENHIGADRMEFNLIPDIKRLIPYVNSTKISSIPGLLNTLVYREMIFNWDWDKVEDANTLSPEAVEAIKDAVRFKFIYGPRLIVKYDKIKVTNELGASIDIYDMFVEIKFDSNLTYIDEISGMRSTYTSAQLSAGYVHSHLPTISATSLKADGIKALTFNRFCLGSTNLNSIKHNFHLGEISFDKEAELMEIFTELDRYLPVESIAGGPYIKLEHITQGDDELGACSDRIDKAFSTNKCRQVFENVCLDRNKTIKLLIRLLFESNRLKFLYVNDTYYLSHDINEFSIILTDILNQNKELIKSELEISDATIGGLYHPMRYIDGSLYSYSGFMDVDLSRYTFIGETVGRFKGTNVKLVVTDNKDAATKYRVLHPAISTVVYNSITKFININFNQIQDGKSIAIK